MAAVAAAGAALRLRLLYRLLRVGELLALAVLLSWSSSRVPSAAASVLRLGASLLLDPRFVFVLGNAIVLLLLALSRHDLSLSSNQPAPTPFNSFATPTSPPPAEQESATAEPAGAAAVFEDKQVVRVRARPPRRSRSEKMGSRGGRRAASPELRRSESENGRRRRSSVTARDAEDCRGVEDAEEFRRTVEAFIAKQMRFHREESMTMAVVSAGEVPPAFAGALAVVE